MERTDLVSVSEGLEEARGPIEREVQASRAVWGALVHGLPAVIPGSTRAGTLTAESAATAMKRPAILADAKKLTGPGSGITALLTSFFSLSEHCWEATSSTLQEIEHGSPASAKFARANAALYIGCLYDGHYAASAVGKALRLGYEKLGGAAGFGGSLSEARVNALVAAYSPQAVRLQPKPKE